MFRNYFPLKEFDFTSAQVKVQFGSYFIHTICASLVTISAPWVPLSFSLCSVPSSSFLYNAAVLWTGLDLPQHLKHGLSHMAWKNKSIWFFLVQYFQIHCPNSELCYFVLAAILETKPDFILFFLNWVSLILLTLFSPFQLSYPLF